MLNILGESFYDISKSATLIILNGKDASDACVGPHWGGLENQISKMYHT